MSQGIFVACRRAHLTRHAEREGEEDVNVSKSPGSEGIKRKDMEAFSELCQIVAKRHTRKNTRFISHRLPCMSRSHCFFPSHVRAEM